MTSPPNSPPPSIDPRIERADHLLLKGGQPEQAANQYRLAAEQGVGAAAIRLAVLAAAGVRRPANWDEALDWLVRAAQLGEQSARGQLVVLAGAREEGDLDLPESDWEALRKGIDLPKLLRPPAARSVRTGPSIIMIDGLATPAMCHWLIMKSAPRLKRSLIGAYNTGEWQEDPIRTGLSTDYSIIDSDLVLVLTQERLARVSSLVIQQQEAPSVLAYEEGQEYRAHYDFLLPSAPAFQRVLELMGQRVATCLTWLNDDYDGGETAFPKIGWKHRGDVGDAMLFLNITPDRRPDPLSLHAGLPPTRGRKWLLSQWVRDRAQPII